MCQPAPATDASSRGSARRTGDQSRNAPRRVGGGRPYWGCGLILSPLARQGVGAERGVGAALDALARAATAGLDPVTRDKGGSRARWNLPGHGPIQGAADRRAAGRPAATVSPATRQLGGTADRSRPRMPGPPRRCGCGAPAIGLCQAPRPRRRAGGYAPACAGSGPPPSGQPRRIRPDRSERAGAGGEGDGGAPLPPFDGPPHPDRT
jgi:hypothetical protein